MTATNSSQPISNDNFVGRAIIWALLGVVLRLRGSKLAACAFLGPLGERALGFTLEGVLAEWQRQRQEQERQQRMRQLLQNLTATATTQAPTNAKDKAKPVPVPSASKQVASDKDGKWQKVIRHPSVVLVVGKRGSGKSAVGYWLLEAFRYGLIPYVLGIPAQSQKLLPDWIGIAQNLDDIPHGSIVLVDEAYLIYHSRESLKAQSREMSRIVNLSRQRDQTIIFVTPEARQIDKNIASQANVIVFKEPGMLQLKFDRPELNDITIQAKQAFGSVNGDKRKWAYVYSPDADFMGILEH